VYFSQSEMRTPVTIVLAALVLVANSICACAGPATPRIGHHGHDEAATAHPGCHGHEEAAPDNPEDAPSHDCGHCTRTVIADAPGMKVHIASPLAQMHVLGTAGIDIALGGITVRAGLIDYSGLPPPLAAATLLSLSCSLNN
jgi:hypothetical protein